MGSTPEAAQVRDAMETVASFAQFEVQLLGDEETSPSSVVSPTSIPTSSARSSIRSCSVCYESCAGAPLRDRSLTRLPRDTRTSRSRPGLWTARAMEGPIRPQPLSLFQASMLIHQRTPYCHPLGNILRCGNTGVKIER